MVKGKSLKKNHLRIKSYFHIDRNEKRKRYLFLSRITSTNVTNHL